MRVLLFTSTKNEGLNVEGNAKTSVIKCEALGHIRSTATDVFKE